MTSTPKKQGILPFSTPVQSHSDSGYFGSSCKSSLTKILRWISPIKEHPSKKRSIDSNANRKICSNLFGGTASDSDSYLNEFQSSKFVSQDDSIVGKDFFTCFQGSFTDTVTDKEISKSSLPTFQFHGLKKKINSLEAKSIPSLPQYKDSEFNLKFNFSRFQTKTFSSTHSSREGTFNKFKNEKIDFLKALEEINCILNVKLILSHLSDEDLTKVCCVSRKWREIVLNDKNANSRRKKYLEELIEQKENQRNEEMVLKDGYPRVRIAGMLKSVLSEISCMTVPKKQPLIKQASEKFNSFFEEGRTLKNGILKKCPRCQFAAKSQTGDKYYCKHCDYSFCQSCLAPLATESHSCDKPEVSILVGSKKSKKNLRRL